MGLTVGDRVDGLISGAKAVLAIDHNGVVIELTELPSDAGAGSRAMFDGIRINAIDATETGTFLTAIGFQEIEAPRVRPVAGEQLSADGSAQARDCVVARYGLPEDRHQFTVAVVQHPGTPPTPVPWGGNRQGLYRCALRVENVHEALAQVPDSVERMGDPVWCPLPGTKIEGLHIAFLRSPDGVVFEFVERPLAHFGPQR